MASPAIVDQRLDVGAVVKTECGVAAIGAGVPQILRAVELIAVECRADIEVFGRNTVNVRIEVHRSCEAAHLFGIGWILEDWRVEACVRAPGTVEVIGHHINEVEQRRERGHIKAAAVGSRVSRDRHR